MIEIDLFVQFKPNGIGVKCSLTVFRGGGHWAMSLLSPTIGLNYNFILKWKVFVMTKSVSKTHIFFSKVIVVRFY